jgi:thymidylate kinase
MRSATTRRRSTTSEPELAPRVETSTAGRLFDALDANAVRYCHFKSNANVAAGVSGRTDLDLLVDSRESTLAEELLAGHGFKRLPAHRSRRYPGVEDFFALDEDTGRLLHVHLHYRLIAGERFFKDYRLPWEQEFLNARVVDQPTGIYVAHPELEWLLLACRAALKIRWRDRLRAGGPRRRGEAGGMLSEHRWLAERADAAAVADHARGLLGARAAELVELTLADDLRLGRLTELRRELLRNPRILRGHRRISALGIRWSRELTWIVGSVNRRYLHRPFAYRRSGSSGGIVIAVIGSDGAGKSSVTQALNSWLAPKVDVIQVYFGSGQGRSSLLRLPLKLGLQLMRRRSGGPSLDPEARRTRDVSPSRALWAVLLAREKRGKLRMAMRARERGFVVICDRYPQTDVGGVSDGPILWRWQESQTRPKRALARWERGIYELGEDIAPDVVVRLLVSPDAAASRRPTDNPEELAFRTKLVKDLHFERARHGVVDVDADDELESVILHVKRRLWPLI